jgi:hypothetical protein
MIIITAKKWFQQSYGNTYHSVTIRENLFNAYQKNDIGQHKRRAFSVRLMYLLYGGLD